MHKTRAPLPSLEGHDAPSRNLPPRLGEHPMASAVLTYSMSLDEFGANYLLREEAGYHFVARSGFDERYHPRHYGRLSRPIDDQVEGFGVGLEG